MAAFRKGHVKVVKWMVNHVMQFPSDQEMTRYISTVNDKVSDLCISLFRRTEIYTNIEQICGLINFIFLIISLLGIIREMSRMHKNNKSRQRSAGSESQ